MLSSILYNYYILSHRIPLRRLTENHSISLSLIEEVERPLIFYFSASFKTVVDNNNKK